MYINDKDRIKKLLAYFAEVKDSSFLRVKEPVDFKNVTETCRIIDTLKLPLYYMWEQCCHQSLKDIAFEEHLRKPYHKFVHNPKTYTWEMVVFLALSAPYLLPLKINTIVEITETYNEFIKLDIKQIIIT